MPTTTNRAYRYPLNTASPNVPLDLQHLAEDVDSDVQALRYYECTSSTRPAHANGRRIYETDTGASYISNGTEWRKVRTTVAYAHMGKTDGFQTISSANTVIAMAAAQVLVGGFTFDNANDALVVPFTGNYRVTAKYYVSGASDYGFSVKVRTVAGTDIDQITDRKVGGAEDVTKTMSCIRALTAGDKLRLVATHSVTNALAWGSDGYAGCYLNMEYLG